MTPAQQFTATPPEIDARSSHAALRAIATLEAIKGAAVILIGLGLLTLLHKDVQQEAEHFHDPSAHEP